MRGRRRRRLLRRRRLVEAWSRYRLRNGSPTARRRPASRRRSLHFVYPGSKSPQARGIDIPFDSELLPRYRATSFGVWKGSLTGGGPSSSSASQRRNRLIWWAGCSRIRRPGYYFYSCVAVSAVLPVEDCVLLRPNQDDRAFGPSRYGFDRTVLLRTPEPGESHSTTRRSSNRRTGSRARSCRGSLSGSALSWVVSTSA